MKIKKSVYSKFADFVSNKLLKHKGICLVKSVMLPIYVRFCALFPFLSQQIEDIKLIRDHETNRSQGYGFITVSVIVEEN